MSKRSSMRGSSSRALFTNTAKRTHPKNLGRTIMRGGYRL